jgi:hypothetical protein
LLPGLSQVELDVVIASATALKAVAAQPSRRPLKKRKPKKKKKPGVAQKVSVHADVAEYKEYKAAQRALRSLEKETGKRLAQLNGSSDLSEEQSNILLRFRTAQDCWFRAKAKLSHDLNKDSLVEERKEEVAAK